MTVTEEINVVLSYLDSKVKIRKVFSELMPDQLEKLIKRVNDVNDEIVQKIREEEAQQEIKRQKLKEVQEFLSEKGIDINDLLDFETSSSSLKSKKERKKRDVVKFNFKFAENDIRELSLTGRNPKDVEKIIKEHPTKKEKWQFLLESDRIQYINYLERTDTVKNKKQAEIARIEFNLPKETE